MPDPCHSSCHRPTRKGLGADRLLIYGSLVQEEGRRFRLDSDIDLRVYGLPLEAWQTAFQALEDLEGFQDIAVDLKRAEEVSGDFLEYVEQAGRFVEMTGGQEMSSLRGSK
ncbi:MAG: hypothetical protein AB1568_13845 [Thermodesulfobacteriota bacterium]